MAVQTGRTTFKHVAFIVDDSTSTLRSINIDSLSVVGLKYDEVDLTAWQDAVKSSLPSMPDAPIDIGGVWDTSVVAAVPTLSGSHTVLNGINGLMTPLTVDIQFGIRHAWEAGEPQFGITATSVNGYYLSSYTYDPSSQRYSATFRVFSGSAAPAWGTVAET